MTVTTTHVTLYQCPECGDLSQSNMSHGHPYTNPDVEGVRTVERQAVRFVSEEHAAKEAPIPLKVRAFMYLLLRDHLPSGKVVSVFETNIDLMDPENFIDFTSPELLALADALAERLR